jgi:hypothetical protein
MRLLHRILSMDILVPPPQVVPQGVGNLEYIHQNMKQVANLRKSNLVTQSQSGVVVPVVVDNVARYYAENQKKFYQPREIPNWAPPWPVFFLEWEEPSQWCISGKMTTIASSGMFGFIVVSFPIKDESKHRESSKKSLMHLISGLIGGEPIDLDKWVSSWIDDANWMVFCDPWAASFGRPDLGRPIWLGYTTLIAVASDGRYLSSIHSSPTADYLNQVCEEENPGHSILSSTMHILGLALSFLHCKNTSIHESVMTTPKQERRSHIPRTVFRTLVIDPNLARSSTEGQSTEMTIPKSLHICRGHFATYSEDHPLFGKYPGTFWRPSHVRGSDKVGKVVKTYEVEPC